MGKKTNKVKTWIKNLIGKLDELFAKMCKAELTPMLPSIIGFSLISFIALVIAVIICESFDVDEKVVNAIGIACSIGMSAYIIKMLLPNIKLIKSIVMKIVYVVLNFVVVGIAGTITIYAIYAVIMIVIGYFVLMLVLGGLGGGNNKGSEPTADERSNCRYFSNHRCTHPGTDFSNDLCTSNGDCQSAGCQFYN